MIILIALPIFNKTTTMKLEIEFESEIFSKLSDFCHHNREFDPFSTGIDGFVCYKYLPKQILLFRGMFTPLMNELHRNFQTI